MGDKRRHRPTTPHNPITGKRNPQGPPAPDLTRLATMQVVSLEDDYLVCTGLDPETGKVMNDVLVAKPYLLQKTPWDGRWLKTPEDDARNYTDSQFAYSSAVTRATRQWEGGSIPDNYVTETIEPPYFVGDIIVAAKPMTRLGETPGMPDPDDPAQSQPTNEEEELARNMIIMTNGEDEDSEDFRHIAWMDINVAGRRWTSRVTICRATLINILDTADETATVNAVLSFTGAQPTDNASEQLTVYNFLGLWTDATSDPCLIMWNEKGRTWALLAVLVQLDVNGDPYP